MAKMTLPPQIKGLISNLQIQWATLRKHDFLSETALASLNTEAGIADRANNPTHYEENANRILDFYVFIMPTIIETTMGEYEENARLSILQALYKRTRDSIHSSGHYLDPDHGVPILYQSDLLYRKLKLLKTFITELLTCLEQNPELINLPTQIFIHKFVIGNERQEDIQKLGWITKNAIKIALAFLSGRQRLKSITEQIELYEERAITLDVPPAPISLTTITQKLDTINNKLAQLKEKLSLQPEARQGVNEKQHGRIVNCMQSYLDYRKTWSCSLFHNEDLATKKIHLANQFILQVNETYDIDEITKIIKNSYSLNLELESKAAKEYKLILGLFGYRGQLARHLNKINEYVYEVQRKAYQPE